MLSPIAENSMASDVHGNVPNDDLLKQVDGESNYVRPIHTVYVYPYRETAKPEPAVISYSCSSDRSALHLCLRCPLCKLS